MKRRRLTILEASLRMAYYGKVCTWSELDIFKQQIYGAMLLHVKGDIDEKV